MSIENHWKPSNMKPPISKFITLDGKTLSVLDWARIKGLKVNTLYKRMMVTDDPEKILKEV